MSLGNYGDVEGPRGDRVRKIPPVVRQGHRLGWGTVGGLLTPQTRTGVKGPWEPSRPQPGGGWDGGPHAVTYKLRPRLGWVEGQAGGKDSKTKIKNGTGRRSILEAGWNHPLSSTASGSGHRGDWLLGNHARKDTPTTKLASNPASCQKPSPSLGAIFESGKVRGLSQERQPVHVKRKLERGMPIGN